MQTIIPHPTDESETYWTGACNGAYDDKGSPIPGIFSQIIKRFRNNLLPNPDTIRTLLSHCLDKTFLNKLLNGNADFTDDDIRTIDSTSTNDTEIKKQLLKFLRKGLQNPSFLTDGLTATQIKQKNKNYNSTVSSPIPFNLREFEPIFKDCIEKIIHSSEPVAADAGVDTVHDDADDDAGVPAVPDAANAAAVVNSPSNPSGDIVAPSIPYRRNKSADIEKTRSLTQELHNKIDSIMPYLNKIEKLKLINMLEKTPEMLEFIGDHTVLVHSYYSKASQYLTNNKTICEKSKEVRDLLQAYYTNEKTVRLTDKLEGICLSSTQLTSSDSVPQLSDSVHQLSPKTRPRTQPNNRINLIDVLGGFKSRRIRRCKHNRKTRHKRARKTRRGHSHSRKLKRHLRIRKHKKYTSRRK